jgi:ABC-2 type transport system permease protein
VTDDLAAVPSPAAAASRLGLSDLTLIARQIRYEQLAFWRNRMGAIFTVGFSVVFLTMLGVAAGTQRISYMGDIKLVQYYVPGFAAYGVMAACFMTLSTVLVNRRESGLLKRLRLSPLPAWVFLLAIFASTAVVALVQVVLLLVIGRWVFGVHFPDQFLPFVVAVLVGVLSFTALGVAMSTVLPNPESAGPVTSIVFFVLLFLSGLWFPIKTGSGLARLSAWFPVRHFIVAVFAPFDVQHGVSPWAWRDLAVVAVWGVGGTIVAARRFRWSPRRS